MIFGKEFHRIIVGYVLRKPLTMKNPITEAAANPIPAFHHTNGSDLIRPKCFKFLYQTKAKEKYTLKLFSLLAYVMLFYKIIPDEIFTKHFLKKSSIEILKFNL